MTARSAHLPSCPLALLRGLHAEWRKLSPDLQGPEGLTEREFRLYWTNSKLGKTHGRSVNSWNELSERQARFILRSMREETGDGPAYRTKLIRRMALELWGESCESFLITRLKDRYDLTDPRALSPKQAHEFMEELISRIARKEVTMTGDELLPEILERRMEEVRKRFKAKG